jgi:hypothetical protein
LVVPAYVEKFVPADVRDVLAVVMLRAASAATVTFTLVVPVDVPNWA